MVSKDSQKDTVDDVTFLGSVSCKHLCVFRSH